MKITTQMYKLKKIVVVWLKQNWIKTKCSLNNHTFSKWKHILYPSGSIGADLHTPKYKRTCIFCGREETKGGEIFESEMRELDTWLELARQGRI